MEAKRTYTIDGVVYDPDSITVGELRRHGIDPLAGSAPAQVIGVLYARDHTDDEVLDLLSRAQTITETVVVESAVFLVPEGGTVEPED